MTTSIPAREFAPEIYPPFPDGLPMIELKMISLAKLEAGDTAEQDLLFDICKKRGFFYLDFSNTTAALLPSQSEDLARFAEDFFKLPQDEKNKYNPGVSGADTLFGYKSAGEGVVDAKGTKQTNEFFNLPKTDLIQDIPSLPWPSLVHTTKPFLTTYMRDAHRTGLTVMSVLAKKLSLPSTAFSTQHRFEQPAGDHIRLICGPPRSTKDQPEIQTAGHTDFGTITILFNWLGGLQIWSESNAANFENVVDPSEGEWRWVKPRRGCAIVNLGDAAVKFTNGLFCSGRHRVVPAPGEQGLLPRYSVVYFVRPEDEAILTPLESELIPKTNGEKDQAPITARQWIADKNRGVMGRDVKSTA